MSDDSNYNTAFSLRTGTVSAKGSRDKGPFLTLGSHLWGHPFLRSHPWVAKLSFAADHLCREPGWSQVNSLGVMSLCGLFSEVWGFLLLHGYHQSCWCHGVFWPYPWVLLWLCCLESLLEEDICPGLSEKPWHISRCTLYHTAHLCRAPMPCYCSTWFHANLRWSWIFFQGFIFFKWSAFPRVWASGRQESGVIPFFAFSSRTDSAGLKQASEALVPWGATLVAMRTQISSDIALTIFLVFLALSTTPTSNQTYCLVSKCAWLYLPVSCLWSLLNPLVNPFTEAY